MSDPVSQPLNAQTLAYWSDRVPAPAYARELVTPGVVHFGAGVAGLTVCSSGRSAGQAAGSGDCPELDRLVQ